MGTADLLGEVRNWIARLDLPVEDVATLVKFDAQQLERMLDFPELAPSLRQLVQILDGLGLGLAGVEPLTTAMIVRHLDRCREAKKMSKVELAKRADVNRTHMTFMFQHTDPDPKLDTVLKIAAALDCDLKLEQRRTIARPITSPRPITSEASPPTGPANDVLAASPARSTPPVEHPPATRPSATTPRPPAPELTTSPPAPTCAASSLSPSASNPNAPSPPPSADSAPSPAVAATSPGTNPAANTPSSPGPWPTTLSPTTASPTAPVSRPASPAGTPATDSAPRAEPPPPVTRPTTTAPSAPSPAATVAPPRPAPEARGASSTPSPSATATPTSEAYRASSSPAGGQAQSSATPSSPPDPAASTPSRAASRPTGSTTHPTSATSRPTSAASRPTAPPSAPSTTRTPSTAPPRPSAPPTSAPPPTATPAPPAHQPASATAPNHLDPTTNEALAHTVERILHARLSAELAAQQAQHELEKLEREHEHERQLARRAALERALAQEKARTDTVLVGGSAAAVALAGTAALALQTPENRRTAQAALCIGSGVLTVAGALADEDSSARKVLIAGGIAAGVLGIVDFFRQKFSESRGSIGVSLKSDNDILTIYKVRPNSAAAVAGLSPGDELIRVDGLPVLQIGHEEAYRRLHGAVGTPVHIAVRRSTMPDFEWNLTLIRTPQ